MEYNILQGSDKREHETEINELALMGWTIKSSTLVILYPDPSSSVFPFHYYTVMEREHPDPSRFAARR